MAMIIDIAQEKNNQPINHLQAKQRLEEFGLVHLESIKQLKNFYGIVAYDLGTKYVARLAEYVESEFIDSDDWNKIFDDCSEFFLPRKIYYLDDPGRGNVYKTKLVNGQETGESFDFKPTLKDYYFAKENLPGNIWITQPYSDFRQNELYKMMFSGQSK